jgi:glutathione peroxidase
MNIFDILFLDVRWGEHTLAEYRGKVILIVNTATKCGLAPQFEWLEELYQTYMDRGLVVLGFPCAQFANQETVSDSDMQATCKINFWVTFPLFARIDVNGKDTHPLYQYLKEKKWGWLSSAIKWNFTKFLIDREGNIIERFAPTIEPKNMISNIEKLL